MFQKIMTKNTGATLLNKYFDDENISSFSVNCKKYCTLTYR